MIDVCVSAEEAGLFTLNLAIKLLAGCNILPRFRLDEKVVTELRPSCTDSEIDWPASMTEPESREINDEAEDGFKKEKEADKERRAEEKELASQFGWGAVIELTADKGLATASPKTAPLLSVCPAPREGRGSANRGAWLAIKFWRKVDEANTARSAVATRRWPVAATWVAAVWATRTAAWLQSAKAARTESLEKEKNKSNAIMEPARAL